MVSLTQSRAMSTSLFILWPSGSKRTSCITTCTAETTQALDNTFLAKTFQESFPVVGSALKPSQFPVCCWATHCPSMRWLTLHTYMMNSGISCCLVIEMVCLCKLCKSSSFSPPFWPPGGSRVKVSGVKSHLLNQWAYNILFTHQAVMGKYCHSFENS